METTLDLSRWRELPRGVGYRRWTIVSAGLRQLLSTRFFRFLLGVAWSGGLVIAMLGFAFSQALATGGWLESIATRLGPRAEALFAALSGLTTLYPDICIRGLFTLIFWLHSYLGLWLSLIALTVLVPQLITRDRASNALTVYLSRPLTSFDYLLGKLGTVAGVLVLLWTGPLVAGWLLSMLLAPDRDFMVYSLAPLGRALLFNGVGLVALAAIALGVSTISQTSRNTVVIWLGLWLIFGVVSSPPKAPHWIQRMSFTHDLSEVRQQVLRVDSAFADASEKLPLLDRDFAAKLTRASEKAQADDVSGAYWSLAAFSALSSFVFFRKLRAE
jgi:ABC-2 type transport system permease protein